MNILKLNNILAAIVVLAYVGCITMVGVSVIYNMIFYFMDGSWLFVIFLLAWLLIVAPLVVEWALNKFYPPNDENL